MDFFFGGAFIPSHSACNGGYKGPMFLLCSRAGVTVANDPKSISALIVGIQTNRGGVTCARRCDLPALAATGKTDDDPASTAR